MTTNNSSNGENPPLDIKGLTRAFVLEYAAGRGITELKDDEPLLNNNLIDSLGSFRMIAFLEETFPLTIEDTDMVPENFETLNAVETFVTSKVAKANRESEQPAQPPLAPAAVSSGSFSSARFSAPEPSDTLEPTT